jgi:deferrochelatase/peroxidase EfeB
MEQARQKDIDGGDDRLAAKAVGRWRSGAPLALAPDQDDRAMRVPNKINNFDFRQEPVNDDEGERTPRFAHIRKTYPRDARPREEGGHADNLHRIVRRGIPFGLHFDPALGRGHGQDAERGLIFNAHCADLDDQFEFIQRIWSNNVNFQQRGDGPDPVIGKGGPPCTKRAPHSNWTSGASSTPPEPCTRSRLRRERCSVWPMGISSS